MPPGYGNCLDCGMDTLAEPSEYYMVHDCVWQQTGIAALGGKLCIGCLEARLGRQLTPEDFAHVPLNKVSSLPWSDASERLRSRLLGLP